ncbi:MAG: cell division protein ZapA [Nitrospiraceae bacterium]|nr:MAG: cell division protein ZapA [Nitrospiraceae bacterium]
MHSVEVHILGQSYSIRTDENEAYIKSLAKYIDEKLKEIYSVAPNINQSRAMVMTAFGIADELFKLRSELQNLDKMIEEKTKILSGFLE